MVLLSLTSQVIGYVAAFSWSTSFYFQAYEIIKLKDSSGKKTKKCQKNNEKFKGYRWIILI